MDSIAAPVNDIQFPTITVCQDENKPPDNWALLEMLFNSLSFECSDSSYYGLPTCDSTTNIRNDFKFLIEKTSTAINELMKEVEFSDKSLSSTLGNVRELVEKVAVSLTNGEVDLEDFGNLLNMYFGIRTKLEPILKNVINDTEEDYLVFYNYYATEAPPINCTSSQCQDNLNSAWTIVQTLSEVTSVQEHLSFGSFLSGFLPQLYDEFCEDCFPKDSFSFVTNNSPPNCALTKEDNFLHHMFASISKNFGFDEAISLYDIPAIMSTTKKMTYGIVKKSQSFSYTWCQRNMSVDNSDICYMAWKRYSEIPKPNGTFYQNTDKS